MERLSATVEFYGDQIACIQTQDNIHVVMKPIVERMGLDWSRQLKTIKSDPVLGSVVDELPTTGKDGKTYDMTCLPLHYLNGWLFKIDASLYAENDPRREVIIRYQRECYQVLHDYWHKGAAVNSRDAWAQMQDECRRLKAECNLITTRRRLEKLAGVEVERIRTGVGRLEDLNRTPAFRETVERLLKSESPASTDISTRAMEFILGWASTNVSFFKVTGREALGVWRDGEYVGIYPHKLTEVLKKEGYPERIIRRGWAKRQWIITDQRHFTIAKRVRQGNFSKTRRLVVIPWPVIERFDRLNIASAKTAGNDGNTGNLIEFTGFLNGNGAGNSR